jgi:hypothetical protein
MVCKIWEAARATSAASTFFDPITIGKYGETFVDGGVLVNNPVEVVFNEACKIWPDLSSRLQCIVSLGTGRPAEKDFGANLLDLGRSLITIATETEITHNRFQQFFRHQQISMGMQDAAYLRFNVSSGLEGIGLDEYNQSSKMAAATKAYLRDQHVLDDIGVFVRLIGGNESTGTKPFRDICILLPNKHKAILPNNCLNQLLLMTLLGGISPVPRKHLPIAVIPEPLVQHPVSNGETGNGGVANRS